MKTTIGEPRLRRMTLAAIGLLAAAGTSCVTGAFAQQPFPNKPIRFIVPYPPGGGTDIVARILATKLSVSLGQPILVDNKPGASTIIGTEMLAKAAPDGYTLGLVTDSHAVNPIFSQSSPTIQSRISSRSRDWCWCRWCW